MKSLVLAGVLILGAASAACAQQAASTSQQAVVTVKVGSTPSPIYVAGQCSFTMQLNGGSLSIDNQSYIKGAAYMAPGMEEWSFPIGCHTGASQGNIDMLLRAQERNGQWVYAGTSSPFPKGSHFKATRFHGTNWRGTLVGFDMTTGPEEQRQRLVYFCLVENDGPQALCGQPQGLDTSSPATTRTINKILAVLKTIVFVNPPANAPAAADTAGGH